MRHYLIFLFFITHHISFSQRFIAQMYPNTTLKSELFLDFTAEKIQTIQINKELNLYSIVTNFNTIEANRFFQYLKSKKSIKYIQEDHLAASRIAPNDSLFSAQWDLNKINLQKVWEKTTGGLTSEADTIVVGIIETEGYDFQHPDLFPNIWRNNAEIPNNKIDDDQNGYVDDFFGLNVELKNDKHPSHFHGTSVAGIIGAKGNNIKGVTGVNWNVKMLLLSECKYESQIIEGYSYLIHQRKLYNESGGKKGAFVVVSNASLGFRGAKVEELPMLCQIYDELGKVGIINIAATDNINTDVDKTFDVPSNCTSDFLIVVTNTDKQDKLYEDAAFGKQSVDLSAPGEGTFTTSSGNSYKNFRGCSAATPHVAGAVALLYSAPIPNLIADSKTNPQKTALLLKDVILEGVQKVPSLEGVTTTGGRLDVFASYQLLLEKYSAIDEITINKIFPNPAIQHLEIYFDTPTFKTHELIIYNFLGQIMAKQVFNPLVLKNAHYDLDVSTLPQGVYFLALGQFGESTKKVIKFVKAK